MGQILNSDAMYEMMLRITPKSLYHLSHACKLYHTLITKNVIHESVKRAILGELRVRLCDKYDGFIEMCKKVNGKIIGSFITQCTDDNNWLYSDGIVVCIPKHTHVKSDMPNCLERNDVRIPGQAPGIYTEYENTIEQYITNGCCSMLFDYCSAHGDHTIRVDCVRFDVSGHYIYLYELYDKKYPISTKKFVTNFYPGDVDKNIYDIKLDKLYVHKMNDVFAKRTMLPEPSLNHLDSIRKILERGFEFYDNNQKTISNFDIIGHFYDIVKIKKLDYEFDSMTTSFRVDDHTIYSVDHVGKLDVPLFHVIETTSRFGHMLERFVTHSCRYETCIVQQLCPGLNHRHGEHVDFVNERKSDTEIIFIIVV